MIFSTDKRHATRAYSHTLATNLKNFNDALMKLYALDLNVISADLVQNVIEISPPMIAQKNLCLGTVYPLIRRGKSQSTAICMGVKVQWTQSV